MKIKSNILRRILLVFIILFLTVLIFYYFPLVRQLPQRSASDKISDFKSCVEAGYAINESNPPQCIMSDGRVFIEELNNSGNFQEGQTSIKGVIDCLPKKGSGQQTMECAIGLRGTDGKYYGLKNLSRDNPGLYYSGVGKKVDVYGNLQMEGMTAPDGNNFDIAGVIRIDSITELNNSNNVPEE